MNEVLKRIKTYANEKPESKAYVVYDIDKTGNIATDSLTWLQLDEYSDRLGAFIRQNTKTKTPIVVYGHKSKFMLVCFLACIKSGHAYCPVDVSVPTSRVQDIIDTVSPEMLFSVVEGEFVTSGQRLSLKTIEDISMNTDAVTKLEYSDCVKPGDDFYIIFTSGSTGKPKGVRISSECLANYLKWAQDLGKFDITGNPVEGGVRDCGYRFLNQAPFSFDLSVMDVYLSLYTGGTICAISKDIQRDLKLLYRVLPEADVNVWVSTPSFGDVCLSDRIYNKNLLPNLKLFLFCGEILTNRTAEKLRTAFPDSIIVNTYGPTESTVCITEVVIDDKVIEQYSPLPVGAPKPGTWLYILDENGSELPEGEQGEIVIVGDTVSTGYYKNPDQTQKVFGKRVIEGVEYRLYKTGDKGYVKGKQLFYCGRIDFQIKLHGYRIEIEDIENNLVKVKGIDKAVVLPNYKDDKVQSLTAYVVYREKTENDFNLAQEIKVQLKQFVPEYMIPKKIVFLDALPMTINGKIDRKALGGK